MEELYLLANGWKDLGDYQTAIDTYDIIINHHTSSTDIYKVYHNKGYCLDKIGLCNEAIDCYNIALSLQPNIRTFLSKAFVLYQLGNDDDALLTLDHAINLGLYDNKVLLFKKYMLYKQQTLEQQYNSELLLVNQLNEEEQQKVQLFSSSELDNNTQTLLGEIIFASLNLQ